MSPTSFIGNPLLWLELVSSHKVDWTTSPDFAYRLCHKRFTSLKKPLESPLDLSRCMFLNCAEPVRPDTIELFEEAFKPSGLGTNPNVEWFGAGYGLAEHVVAATYAQGPAIRSRSRPDLVASGKIAKLEPTQVSDPGRHTCRGRYDLALTAHIKIILSPAAPNSL
jgi:acyl-CoA synthetase (AMP-forming)/AMP-acid ligase II